LLAPGDAHTYEDGGSTTNSDSISQATDPVLQMVAKILQAQTEAIAAQVRAAAVQHLPQLPVYTGEGREIADDGFDRWVEILKKCSHICSWTPEKTAAEVFRMLPETERDTVEKAVDALEKRFRPVDI